MVWHYTDVLETWNEGDKKVVQFSNSFLGLKNAKIELEWNPIPTFRFGHRVFFRWTYDVLESNAAEGRGRVNWSAWVPLTDENLFRPFGGQIKDLDFEVLVERWGTSGYNLLKSIKITGEQVPSDAIPIKKWTECTATGCDLTGWEPPLVKNGSALFRPYEHLSRAKMLNQSLNCVVNDVLGHCVRWFKTKRDPNSGDPILKEFTQFSVDSVKDIKIMLPGNSVPDGAIQYGPYQMNFQDSIEAQVVVESFQRAFGVGTYPQEGDYLYFPMLDRIYEVGGSTPHKGFMGQEVWWRIQLWKWQDRQNIRRENPEINEWIEDLYVGIDERIGESIVQDTEEAQKPKVWSVNLLSQQDATRNWINTNTVIDSVNLQSNWTVIAKNAYNLTKGPTGAVAIEWKPIQAETNLSIQFWIEPKWQNNWTGSQFITWLGGSVSLGATSILVESGGIWELPITWRKEWQAISVAISPEHSQIVLYHFGLGNPKIGQKTVALESINRTVISEKPTLKLNGPVRMINIPANVTNFRFWKEVPREEDLPLLLAQWTPKDTHLALMVDNAIPPLKMVKEWVR